MHFNFGKSFREGNHMYKVFLVDDDELILDQIVNTIPWMENGFEVIGCESDAVVALKKVFEIKPHVVFIDLKMPKLDGHSFIHSVREQGMDTEFIMLSAFGTFEDARTFFQQDGFDYLLKPFRITSYNVCYTKLLRARLFERKNGRSKGSGQLSTTPPSG